jgi:hypothetical protein
MTGRSVNICFVANFFKTFVFHEIAIELRKRGIGVYWIVTKKDQHKFLTEHYGQNNVLYVHRGNIEKPMPPVDDLRLNELVYGDRVFNHEPLNGLKFLTNIQKPIYDFLKHNKVGFVFGEYTWAHECLIYRLVTKRTELQCDYLDCSLVRIPNKRVAFFRGEDQGEIVEFNRKVDGVDPIRIERPSYLVINDKLLKQSASVKGRLGRLKRFFTGENIEANDPNVLVKRRTRLKVAGKEEYNRATYRRIETADFSAIENENYIFFGFHKQPESSIDVYGRYYEDQAVLIINLWRLLPQGWKIVIKEHTNAIGDRSTSFYRRIIRYPGIVMVNEKTESRKLIEKSRLVATVSGTIAYEAALLKKPAITFSKIYFNRLNSCRHITFDRLMKYNSLTDLVKELESQPDNIMEYSRFIAANTFEGYISDIFTDSSVIEAENINKLTNAFLEVISLKRA